MMSWGAVCLLAGLVFLHLLPWMVRRALAISVPAAIHAGRRVGRDARLRGQSALWASNAALRSWRWRMQSEEARRAFMWGALDGYYLTGTVSPVITRWMRGS